MTGWDTPTFSGRKSKKGGIFALFLGIGCDDEQVKSVKVMVVEDDAFSRVALIDALKLQGLNVVAGVVDVDPFTTVTGPRAPEVPAGSAACEFVGAKKTKTAKHTTALRKLRDLLIDTGSFKLE